MPYPTVKTAFFTLHAPEMRRSRSDVSRKSSIDQIVGSLTAAITNAQSTAYWTLLRTRDPSRCVELNTQKGKIDATELA